MVADRRVLSVQSHVVHGYVGNRAAVFPLQLLGFEVDVINSVQMCCHGGYPTFTGQRLDGDDLRTLVQGLAANEVLNHSHLLTGYIGKASFLREIVWLRSMLPSDCCYLCDPVLGDNGALYVPEELVGIYRAEVLPHVSVLTPNQFEAELLAETKISNLADAAAACDALHKLGPKTIIITSMDIPDATCGGQSVAMMLSEAQRSKWLLRLPRLEGSFVGTGDLAAAMILGWTQLHLSEAPAALEKTGAVLQEVLRRTVSLNSSRVINGKRVAPELKIIDCKQAIEDPPVVMRCHLVDPLKLLGVVLDLDPAPAEPDVRRYAGQLKAHQMRAGLVAGDGSACPDCEDLLVAPQGSGPPSGAVPALHCCERWGVEPSSVLVVCGAADRLQCNKAAGFWTAAMLEPGPSGAAANALLAVAADFTVSTLDALQRFYA